MSRVRSRLVTLHVRLPKVLLIQIVDISYDSANIQRVNVGKHSCGVNTVKSNLCNFYVVREENDVIEKVNCILFSTLTLLDMHFILKILHNFIVIF